MRWLMDDMAPQWSRSLRSGITRDQEVGRLSPEEASMEPLAEERNHVQRSPPLPTFKAWPQWSRSLGSGITNSCDAKPRGSRRPQWSRSLGGGNTYKQPATR